MNTRKQNLDDQNDGQNAGQQDSDKTVNKRPHIVIAILIFLVISLLASIFRTMLLPFAFPPEHFTRPSFILTTIPDEAHKSESTKIEGNTSGNHDRRQMLQDVSTLFGRIPFVSRILGAVAEFAPLLLAWYLLKENRNPMVQQLLNFTKLLVMIHFVIYTLPATQSLYLYPPIQKQEVSFLWNLQQILGTTSLPMSMNFDLGLKYAGIAVLGIFLPATIWQWRLENGKKTASNSALDTIIKQLGIGRWLQRSSENTNKYVEILIHILVIAFCLILPLFAIVRSGWGVSSCGTALNDFLIEFPQSAAQLFDPSWLVMKQGLACSQPVWIWITLFSAGILGLSVRWLMNLTAYCLKRKYSALVYWIGTLIVLGFHVVDLPTVWINQAAQGKAWFALELFLEFALTAGIAVAGVRGIFHMLDQKRLSFRRTSIILIVILLALLSIPTLGFVDSSKALGRPSDIYQLAYRWDDNLFLLWVVALLCILYKDGKDNLNLSYASRILALLATSAYLFGLTQQFLYVPVAFLLGVFTLWQVTDLPALGRQPQRTPNQVQKWIRSYGLVRLSEQMYGSFRREKTKKLASGEIKLNEFFDFMDEYENKKKSVERQIPKRTNHTRINPLAFGPASKAWQNAVYGTSWSLVIALPWIMIFTFSFLNETKFNTIYPLLSFIDDLVNMIGLWAAIGFVMGYFFPYLRGSSGLEKGLIMGLVLVAARLPLSLAYNSSLEDWQATLVLSMQIFIQCLLLGLLTFDYAILRKWHFSFQQLLEFHGLSGLGIWISTLIAAVAGALTPLLTTQATGIWGILANIVGKFAGIDLSGFGTSP